MNYFNEREKIRKEVIGKRRKEVKSKRKTDFLGEVCVGWMFVGVIVVIVSTLEVDGDEGFEDFVDSSFIVHFD